MCRKVAGNLFIHYLTPRFSELIISGILFLANNFFSILSSAPFPTLNFRSDFMPGSRVLTTQILNARHSKLIPTAAGYLKYKS